MSLDSRRLHSGEVLLTRSLPLARPLGLPVYVARLPPAPFSARVGVQNRNPAEIKHSGVLVLATSYSRTAYRRTTIGAAAFHCRVRNGNGWGKEAACFRLDYGGKSHHIALMPMTKTSPKQNRGLTVVERYDVAADAKKRINLRNAKTKYFHVKALSNGAYVLEPRVLVPPAAISARSLRILDKSVANLKKGVASAPIDLSAFLKA